jgi:hypothetical protein
MTTAVAPSQVEAYITEKAAAGLSRQQIEELLSQPEWNDEERSEATVVLNKLSNARRRKMGTAMVLAGAFLCVFGFAITMVLLQHEVNFGVALYGATGLGGTLLLGGMVAILG